MNLEGLTILVLEDEPIIAMALEENLEHAGALPRVAGSIQHAAEILAAEAIDAAILDINVHGQKSYGIAESLIGKDVPFIFASGYGGTVHQDGFAHVPTVTKPYDLAAIQNAFGDAFAAKGG